MDVELRHLRAFVAVAEELNFTRAAARLFIAQQALSAQVRQLEARLGTRLFDRDTRRVSLTADGEVFLGHARRVLADMDEAVAAVGAAPTRLNLGFVVSVEHAMFSDVVSGFTQRHPEVEVMMRFGDTTDPAGGLRGGATDVAFVYGPFDRSGLETRYLFDEPLGVLMAASHRLASKPELRFEDVVDEPTFDFPTPDRNWHDFWMGTALRGGRPPKIVAAFETIDGLVAALRAGLGVHTGTRMLGDAAGSGVVWREVPDLPRLEHFVAWKAGDTRAVVSTFVEDVVAQVSARPPPGSGTSTVPLAGA